MCRSWSYENCIRVDGSKKKMDEWKLFCLRESKEANHELWYSAENASSILQFHQYIYILCPLTLLLHRPYNDDFIQVVSSLRHNKKYWGKSLNKPATPWLLRLYNRLDLCFNPGSYNLLQFNYSCQSAYFQAIYLFRIYCSWMASNISVHIISCRCDTRTH